ncbi:MAG: glyoxalase, partial [Calditrichia bacterium]|nr:glyoxalase [Calditrichia bacterium]
MKNAMFILYVKNQDASMEFYSKVLGLKPALYVPGMTEFVLNDGSSLGLMPISGIKKLLGDKLPDPEKAGKFPKSELYLTVDEPGEFY